ncbi:hypothetical protein [uncultured Bacteroides sp.]|uniref:hypothetical protein n=1 Tax=uncultured Bacteroides sp. TaxID=162156 RepID=UPI000820590D|nr:hypothetical protein [uncultured Bacteroides sp.]SCH14967.1 Uncharacterised protein [uncultured Bacteroides sp.]
MTNKERIKEQELKDREEVIRLFNGLFKDLKYTQLPISASTDITVTASTTNKVGLYNVEIKERDISINRFNDCFLEVMKHDSLKSTYTDHKPLYVALYPDNRIACVWSINDLDFNNITKTKRWMNKSTYCNKEKVLKDVYLLPLELAKQYKY